MSNKTRKKQIKDQAQQGRSMVEMLGVLAIIGVISIGGIAGYRMAMNRYQANQIANEINLMRTDAKMKVARGVELLLGAPYDGEDGHLNFNANYGVAVAYPVIISDEEGEEGGEKGYSFTLSGIPAGVCKPLATLLDSIDDTAALEINGKDYETAENLCDNEENEVLVAFSTKDLGVSGGEKEICDEATCEGECTESGCEQCSGDTPYWNGNLCVGCPSDAWNDETKTCDCSGGRIWNIVTGECVCSDTNKHWNESSSSCESCGADEVWNNGQCEKPESYCRTNADCNQNGKSGYYCHTSGIAGVGGCFEFEYGNSYTTGKCYPISSDLTKKAKINGTTYYGSGRSMTWWSACRLCAARAGGDESECASGTEAEPDFMAGYDMLQCADPNVGKNGSTAYCYETSEGNTSFNSANILDVFGKLKRMFGGNYWLWLKNGYSSCFAYNVYLNDGRVGYYTRLDHDHALCR